MTAVSIGALWKQNAKCFCFLIERDTRAHTRTGRERGDSFFLIARSISLMKPYTALFPSLCHIAKSSLYHFHFFYFFPPDLCVFFRKKTQTDKRRTHTRERKTSGGQINHVATRVCHDAKTLFWRRSKRSASGKCVFNAEEFSFFFFFFFSRTFCVRVSVWNEWILLMFLRAHLSLSFSLFFFFSIAKKCAGVHLEHETNAL